MMNKIKKINFTFDEKEIHDFSINFAKILEIKDVILLIGDLGAGKTSFVKNICKFFNQDEDEKISISSPTFLFYHLYEFKKLPIWHFDLYRFKNQVSWNDLCDIDLDEALENGCSILEWGDKLNYKIEKNIIKIKIDFLKNDPSKRIYEIEFSDESPKWNEFFQKF